MTRITAAGFSERHEAEQAVSALLDAGFRSDETTRFSLVAEVPELAEPANAHGQEGAQTAGSGAVGGAAGGGTVGVVVGLATAPLLGPVAPVVGAAVGAYVGSLVGTMNQLEEPAPGTPAAASPAPPISPPAGPPRSARWMVAVATPSAQQQATAIAVLQRLQARDIEEAQGQIVAGTWIDFDPQSPLRLLDVD